MKGADSDSAGGESLDSMAVRVEELSELEQRVEEIIDFDAAGVPELPKGLTAREGLFDQ